MTDRQPGVSKADADRNRALGAGLVDAPYPTYHRLREIFSSRDCVWNDRCQARLFHSALVLAQRGLGAALVDPFTIDSQPLDEVVIRRFESPVAYDIAVIWAKDRPLSVLGRTFVPQLLQQMQSALENFANPACLSPHHET